MHLQIILFACCLDFVKLRKWIEYFVCFTCKIKEVNRVFCENMLVRILGIDHRYSHKTIDRWSNSDSCLEYFAHRLVSVCFCAFLIILEFYRKNFILHYIKKQIFTKHLYNGLITKILTWNYGINMLVDIYDFWRFAKLKFNNEKVQKVIYILIKLNQYVVRYFWKICFQICNDFVWNFWMLLSGCY